MSFATLITEVEADAKAAINAVVGGAEKLAEEIGPVVVADAEALLKELFNIATTAVLAEAQKAISGQEKFGNAVANVIQTVEAQDKAVVLQDAHMAVQGAFNIVKLQLSTN